jgi:uncharacterized integral membrane protein
LYKALIELTLTGLGLSSSGEGAAMKFRTVLVFLMLAAVAVFALSNWTAFTAPTHLSLGFLTFQAPLGLVMLVLTGVVSGLLLVYIVFQQAGVILEARRYAKELSSHRELADKAEASRFTELRAFLEAELRRLEAQNAAGTRELGARIDQLQGLLKARLHS